MIHDDVMKRDSWRPEKIGVTVISPAINNPLTGNDVPDVINNYDDVTMPVRTACFHSDHNGAYLAGSDSMNLRELW